MAQLVEFDWLRIIKYYNWEVQSELGSKLARTYWPDKFGPTNFTGLNFSARFYSSPCTSCWRCVQGALWFEGSKSGCPADVTCWKCIISSKRETPCVGELWKKTEEVGTSLQSSKRCFPLYCTCQHGEWKIWILIRLLQVTPEEKHLKIDIIFQCRNKFIVIWLRFLDGYFMSR